MEDIIKIDKLSFRYNDKFIFDKFSLTVKKGEWLSISGSNGSGKSTLIKLITGILPSNGEINVCNFELNKKNLFSIRKEIGVVIDNLDNMFLCETIKDDFIFVLENLCYSKRNITDTINNISREFNITHLLNKSFNELSGGEKCKVSLALSLIHNPKILILDESLSMIDESEKKFILKKLVEKHKRGLTIISIVHDLSESYNSDRLIILNDGEIILDGTPLKVMEYDKVLNRLGINIPFEAELSLKLKLYGLVDEIIPDVGRLVDTLWK